MNKVEIKTLNLFVICFTLPPLAATIAAATATATATTSSVISSDYRVHTHTFSFLLCLASKLQILHLQNLMIQRHAHT
ncbi:unnamed protein product [Lactuca virosa]|uniref:Secreted protein n=1 Tax=Lactuca virosa TaxID=75947 RepID=A0AAU9N1A1_9ASTR|nr:unnamed protein product [Lactuca virosa]